MASLTLPAPAKINLFLHINGRRDDGYHELQTLFQLLDYGDELTFSKWSDAGPGDLVQVEPELQGVPLTSNLIWKAAYKLREKAGQSGLGHYPYPVKVSVQKKLPMGGGLGGGSSDAATTLLALNHLWQLNFEPGVLAETGKELGADVPVFVYGRTAFAEGIGEKIKACIMPDNWFVIVHPGCHISTAEVFSHKQLTRDTPKSKIAPALEGDLGKLASGHPSAENDCESVVCEMYPAVRKALTWLNQFSPARLTGTGACIFACFTEEERANHVLSHMPANYQGFVARGISESPVFRKLENYPV